MVLLGGDAGLRRGELIGLRWCDVDLKRRRTTVQQAVWKGIVAVPENGRGRFIR
jgi:integrase